MFISNHLVNRDIWDQKIFWNKFHKYRVPFRKEGKGYLSCACYEPDPKLVIYIISSILEMSLLGSYHCLISHIAFKQRYMCHQLSNGQGAGCQQCFANWISCFDGVNFSLMCSEWDSNTADARKAQRNLRVLVIYHRRPQLSDLTSVELQKFFRNQNLILISGKTINSTQQCDFEMDSAAVFNFF